MKGRKAADKTRDRAALATRDMKDRLPDTFDARMPDGPAAAPTRRAGAAADPPLIRDLPALPLLSALSAAAGFLVLMVLAWRAAGVFEYPLDDVYIHLAIAENIAGGTYGINPGEPASAASSILYPLLLLPFAGTEAQRFLPLFWNVAALLALAWLFGLILREAGLKGPGAALLALAGPIALNMPGAAFTGMEHSLHAVCALAAILGLWRFLRGGRIAWWFAAAVILGPMLRLEALALSLLCCGTLAFEGRWRAGLALGAATLAPVVAFMGFLVWLGLDPLPSSVLAKTLSTADGGYFATLKYNLSSQQGVWALILLVLALALGAVTPELRRRPYAPFAAVLVLMVVAHLMAGQFGWLFRYEQYLFVALLSGLILLRPAGRAGLLPVALLGGLGVGAITLPAYGSVFALSSRAVHLQQAQMARLATDYLKAPVAAADIGHLSWRNDNYVLDLWGLGSQEARKARRAPGGAVPGWADALVRRHNVDYAMIYTRLFPNALGPGWHEVARLKVAGETGAVDGNVVAIYATRPGAVPALRDALAAFAPTLPDGATIELLP